MSDHDDPMDPIHVPWEADFQVGHAGIDSQHRALLAQCSLLAERCPGPDGAGSTAAFDQAYAELRSLAQAHFDAEAALLAAAGHPQLEDHLADCEEFGYLADEIATTDHFSRLELQRFLALWWLGHVRGSAGPMRDSLSAGPGSV